MSLRPICHVMSVVAIALGIVAIVPPMNARGDDASQAAAHERNRTHWENVVLFFGEEETGEWSLRIRDQDVHAPGRFDFLELWQFDRKEHRWRQIKTDRISVPIVMPKEKASDQPENGQTLIELKEIEPRTAGLWYGKWKIDGVECGTLMRVGTGRTSNALLGATPDGMIKMAVPIDLNKSEAMFVPDPRIYCIAGGPGLPDAKAPPQPAEKTDTKDAGK